jgi:hypothetical protein
MQEFVHIAELRPVLRAFARALAQRPRYCRLPPLEPFQFLAGQWFQRKTGTPIQTRRPAEAALERGEQRMFEKENPGFRPASVTAVFIA